jgi:hypothetical protein
VTSTLRLVISVLFAVRIAAGASFVQAVEFPYRSFPPQLWDRELVWLKNIGIDKITVSISRGWTESNTAPLIKICRRLGMKLYLSPQPDGPGEAQLRRLLATQFEEHGGPVVIGLPRPVSRVSLISPDAMKLSRRALQSRGSLVWIDVEDTRDASGLHRGAVSFAGDEQPSTSVLRRNALLVQYWAAVLSEATPVGPQEHTKNKLRPTGQLMMANGVSGLNLINETDADWSGDVAAYYPPARQTMTISGVHMKKGDALFLPVNIPLADQSMCRNCQALSKNDRIIFATTELTAVEYENGILAMEFSAPSAGEVVLQLTSEPSGPFLAGGKPSKFDWDSGTMRARLPVPAGQGAASRTRIGLALQPPDASAFFVDGKPLVIGQKNRITTSYSSPEIAQRSRLIVPQNLPFQLKTRRLDATSGDSPLRIDYEVEVPATAVHGDHLQLALEADGIQMGHVRLQLLRPVSVHIRQAVALHYGPDRELATSPPLIPVDAPAGRSIDIQIRNNAPEIRSFTLQSSCEGVELSPSKTDVSIGPSMEREVSIRLFATDAQPGLHKCMFSLDGGAHLDTPSHVVVIPRDKPVDYSLDLDSDGQPEHIVENQRLRAVFSQPDGGRWLEFVAKDANRNVLPDSGVQIGKSSIDLRGTELALQQNVAAVAPGKFGELLLSVEHPAANSTVYSLKRAVNSNER